MNRTRTRGWVVMALGATATLGNAATKDVFRHGSVGANGGEPSIATAPDGTLYVSYPGGAGMGFYRSLDSGKTWKAGAIADTSSGDTTVNVDSSGAVYQAN